jgi:plastocyanin
MKFAIMLFIAVGVIFGAFISTHQTIAQMMGPGMMGPGMGTMQHGMMTGSGMGTMQHGMMTGSGMMMGPSIMFPKVTTNAIGTRSISGINVSIVSDAQNMGNKAFQPNPINVKVGNTVTWVNDDGVTHTITSGSGPNDPNYGSQFDSGLVAEGQTFTHAFKTVAEFNYFCQIHPSMVGTVIVN